MMSIPTSCQKQDLTDPKEIFDGVNDYLDQLGHSSIQKQDLAHLYGKAYLKHSPDGKHQLFRIEPHFDLIFKDALTFEAKLF